MSSHILVQVPTQRAHASVCLQAAEAKAAGGEAESAKPHFVKHGINHITKLVEEKKAELVVIAHDVAPIEVRQSLLT
jgi:large subunit ribosomal protein L7Ae